MGILDTCNHGNVLSRDIYENLAKAPRVSTCRRRQEGGTTLIMTRSNCLVHG